MTVEPNHLCIEECDGEAVIYDRELGAVHRLDAVALAVWRECGRSRYVEGIARRLSQQMGVDVDSMRSQVEDVIVELQERNLLPQDWQETDTVMDRHGSATIDEGSRLISRREILGGGVSKTVLAAPLISTFFATGAYASGPSASGAYGTDGAGDCKNVGYSCAANGDCCGGSTCPAGTCI